MKYAEGTFFKNPLFSMDKKKEVNVNNSEGLEALLDYVEDKINPDLIGIIKEKNQGVVFLHEGPPPSTTLPKVTTQEFVPAGLTAVIYKDKWDFIPLSSEVKNLEEILQYEREPSHVVFFISTGSLHGPVHVYRLSVG